MACSEKNSVEYERFVQNAKPEVVPKERDKQADYQAKFNVTKERIEEMEKLGEW